MNNKKKLTPLMQQYWEVKSQHTDKVLMFRMGDFFEMFHDDARVAAPILNIALTQRNKKSEDDTPMCGMPHHSIAGPIAKLLAAGHKVALCDQIEDPKEAKGLVKRAVTRILSPGMVYDPDTLDQLSANYLCAYDLQHVSFLDVSTGEAFYYRLGTKADLEKLKRILSPVELVLSTEQKVAILRSGEVEVAPLTAFDFDSLSEEMPESAQRLVAYAKYMQGEEVNKSLRPFVQRQWAQNMELSPTVIRHLEIFKTYKGEDKGSLFFAVNRTKTSAGARRLKTWLSFPLTDVRQINERMDRVQSWVAQAAGLKELRKILGGMGDIERRLAKISNPNCHVHDLLALVQSLRAGLCVSQFCPSLEAELTKTAESLVTLIETTLLEDPPVNTKNGGFIRPDYRSDLKELVELAENSQKLLLGMESSERESTGIPSLKIKYNNVFGYFIEVTNAHKDKVPDHYKRKQTLTNAERYITEDLQDLEDKVLSAKAKRLDLETQIFNELRKQVLDVTVDLMTLASQWSELDVVSSLAWLAMEKNYRRPTFGRDLKLKASRHAVVEQEVAGPFVANSLQLQRGDCLLLTGPNMAGKSTIMRQVAVISLMAQMGSFVPAEMAELPIYDRIFTRIGASDYLAEGLSTFMVEMKESAEMLNQATENSLLILDEVGRGTSTYDGMSLAQSILEFLLKDIKCMTLFATHYHELTQLERQFVQVKNVHMSIREKNGDIHFLHTLVPGPANKSYGIEVARLAGLPSKVTQRAKKVLEQVESFGSGETNQLSLMDAVTDESSGLASPPGFVDEIRSVELAKLTPLEALNRIAKWQQSLS